jgi:hypothetical protein
MTDPIVIQGDEQSKLDPKLPDGGLPPAVGVKSFQVFRATRDVPEIADGLGWTYHHHVDMAVWKGRLYVGWNSCEKDEDVWPSRELYSTSADGANWSHPVEMFPQGVSTPLRMYFFHKPNGRMLMIAGLRADTRNTDEDTKGGLVVREIFDDHRVGPIFTLRRVGDVRAPAPMFDLSPDPGFVEACRHLLANKPFLEQQDRGRLLGERRMKWHDPANWPGGRVPGDSDKWVAGKAYSFFRRPDGTLVGVSKMGWVTTSADNGETWTQPLVPPSLITGKAKVWSQRTSDGRYALVYNPSHKNRYPLVIVTSDDGVHFRDMRIIQGELPIQRYEGIFRSIGPQYCRGLSMWSDDGSRPHDNCIWLVYSMNKEDIWVSRVPLPVKSEITEPIGGDFADWNTYQSKWCRIEAANGSLTLEKRDPYDSAIATRVLPEATRVAAIFQADRIEGSGALEVSILTKLGSRCAATTRVTSSGEFTLEASASEPGNPLQRIRVAVENTNPAAATHPVARGTDRPHDPNIWTIRNLRITS